MVWTIVPRGNYGEWLLCGDGLVYAVYPSFETAKNRMEELAREGEEKA